MVYGIPLYNFGIYKLSFIEAISILQRITPRPRLALPDPGELMVYMVTIDSRSDAKLLFYAQPWGIDHLSIRFLSDCPPTHSSF